jgi:hypothetical protein
MNATETGKWLRTSLWMLFIMAMIFVIHGWIDDYQREKGIAISHYLLKQNRILISSEDAKFFAVGASFDTFDIVVKDCNIMPK